MVKKGKIKFSTLNNNRGVKTDFFRVVEDAKDKKGDWQVKAGFPEQMSEMEFYFPFQKMENNIKIAYSGFCNLPSNGSKSRPASYFVVSEGIGQPLIATPVGHNGIIYDGRGNDALTLTEKRLQQWPMVKKRMTMFLTPKGWLPNEYIVWHTTSEIAIGNVLQEYMDLCDLLGDNPCLVPLVFKAVGKSGKNAAGKAYRFFHGSISANCSPFELYDIHDAAKKLRKKLHVENLEKNFEALSYFGQPEDDDNQVPEGFSQVVNQETGEVSLVNQETGESRPHSSQKLDYGDILASYVSKPQASRIVELAMELGREKEILDITSVANALALLNSLQSEHNSKAA